MNRILNLNRNLVALSIPFALFSLLIILITHSAFTQNNTVVLAITADLLITVPVIYFLLIRKTSIPNTTIVPILLLGLAIGTFFLPSTSQSYLNLFKTWAMPVIELAVVSYIVTKVYRIRKNFKSSRDNSIDFFSVLKQACAEILPKKLIPIFATEVAVMYYGFISWKSKKLNKFEFSYHKKSGTTTFLGSFIFIIFIEAIVVHLLLSRWSEIAAWILTGLSFYTMIQVLGFAKSLSRRPILIHNNTLMLRHGILSEVDIYLKDISAIEVSKKSIKEDKTTVKLSPFGELENHNIIIRLKTENTLLGFYGTKKKFKAIAFYIDTPVEFKESLDKAINLRNV